MVLPFELTSQHIHIVGALALPARNQERTRSLVCMLVRPTAAPRKRGSRQGGRAGRAPRWTAARAVSCTLDPLHDPLHGALRRPTRPWRSARRRCGASCASARCRRARSGARRASRAWAPAWSTAPCRTACRASSAARRPARRRRRTAPRPTGAGRPGAGMPRTSPPRARGGRHEDACKCCCRAGGVSGVVGMSVVGRLSEPAVHSMTSGKCFARPACAVQR